MVCRDSADIFRKRGEVDFVRTFFMEAP